jgi:phenylpyruvate tautomerase PptA (4-oxalocrotonate tautomerase family)
MSLHRIYHPPDVFSTKDKQGLAERITVLYTAIGLPEFYVNVIFVPIEQDSLFIGGQPKNKYIRIVVQHLASQLHDEAIKKTIKDKYENAIAAYIKEKDYEWEVCDDSFLFFIYVKYSIFRLISKIYRMVDGN